MAQPYIRLAKHLRDFVIRRPHPACAPFRLWVDITSRCNLRCAACPQRMLPPEERRDMDPLLLGRLVGQVRDLGVGQVNLFHRGEPLLHPEFALWARRFKKAGAAVRVHTNATLLSESRIKPLLEAGFDMLTCSVDSLHPGDYARARPGAELGRVLAGIERLLAMRRDLGKASPKVTLLMMGNQRGRAQRATALERLKSLGLDRAVVRSPHNWGGALAGGGESPQKRPNVCTFPWYGMAVLSNGVITPCPQDFFGKLALGRAPADSLWGAWQGPRALALRRAHAAREPEAYEPCADCDRLWRPTVLGLPTEHLKNFLHESIVSPDI